jgi:hypothetical protein
MNIPFRFIQVRKKSEFGGAFHMCLEVFLEDPFFVLPEKISFARWYRNHESDT